MRVALLLSATAACCASASPLDSRATGPTVTLDYASYQGFTASGITNYRGMSFAAAPTGNLRWKAPQDPPVTTAVQPATAVCPRYPTTSKARWQIAMKDHKADLVCSSRTSVLVTISLPDIALPRTTLTARIVLASASKPRQPRPIALNCQYCSISQVADMAYLTASTTTLPNSFKPHKAKW